MKQTQREAVFAATMSVLADAGITFEEGSDVSTVMSKDIRQSIQAILVEGFKQGTIEFEKTPSNDEKLASPAKLNQYVSGLVSNWFRKDTRMNGGEKYQAKNPGSRAGASDPQLKALRQLAGQFKGTDKEHVITAQIEQRLAAINAEKAKHVTVDISALPPELVAKLGLA